MNQRSLSATDLQSAPFDQTLAFSLIWWTLQESNLGRADLQSAALPTELRVRVGCESGLEPPTSGATNRRSDQLSYSHYEWLQERELNPLGAAYEAVALPVCHPAVWCTKRDSNLRSPDRHSGALSICTTGCIVAPNRGFEPRPPESKSGVLPLHQSGIWNALRDLNLRPPDS